MTICGNMPTGAGVGSCTTGVDTERAVLAPGLPAQSINAAGLGTASDEHSTVFPPGSLGDNPDYRIFVASGFKGVNPDIGVMVLSSPGPDAFGQWTAQPATAQGYGDYAAGPGQVFLPPMKPNMCPDLTDQNGGPVQSQDQTFDLNYAVPGSVFEDTSVPAGRLLMVYEGANDCVGAAGGQKAGNDSYQTIGVATSLDGGRTWPRYAAVGAYTPAPLPLANPASGLTDNHGPQAPMGAMGSAVCRGNSCPPSLPATFGRYEILSASVSLDSLMTAPVPALSGQIGHSEPSAFVDDVHVNHAADGNGLPYVYVVTHYLSDHLAPLQPSSNGRKDDLAVARAKLDRTGAKLQFSKWNGVAFSSISDGLGGTDAPMLPSASDGNFAACGDNESKQGRSQGSISWVEETHQYLLLFVCTSPGDPAQGVKASDTFGSAWFWATNDDLNDQSGWSIPQEIEGSFAEHTEPDGKTGCPLYHGWYPTLMSPDMAPGRLGTFGYVFYMSGSLGPCDQGGLPDRTYSTRQFRIVTGPR